MNVLEAEIKNSLEQIGDMQYGEDEAPKEFKEG